MRERIQNICNTLLPASQLSSRTQRLCNWPRFIRIHPVESGWIRNWPRLIEVWAASNRRSSQKFEWTAPSDVIRSPIGCAPKPSCDASDRVTSMWWHDIFFVFHRITVRMPLDQGINASEQSLIAPRSQTCPQFGLPTTAVQQTRSKRHYILISSKLPTGERRNS